MSTILILSPDQTLRDGLGTTLASLQGCSVQQFRRATGAATCWLESESATGLFGTGIPRGDAASPQQQSGRNGEGFGNQSHRLVQETAAAGPGGKSLLFSHRRGCRRWVCRTRLTMEHFQPRASRPYSNGS